MKNKLFSDTVIRTGREVELDWARAIVVGFMVFVHVLFYPSIYDSSRMSALVIGYFGGLIGLYDVLF